MKSIQESLITRLKVPSLVGNKINAVKCNNCGHIRYPPRTYCNKCQGTDLSPILLGPKGVITTFTSSYKRKATDQQRFFGNVRLFSEDGKDSIGFGGAFDVKSLEELKIGQKVELVPYDRYTIFKIVED